MTTRKNDEPGATRRDFTIGAIGAVGGLAVLLSACNSEAPGSEEADAGTTPPPGGDPDAATPPGGGTPDAGSPGTCTLYPQETEGPFYLDLANLRSDVKDGKEGAGLKVVVQVLSATGCTVLKDAAVDIWHADAIGQYSGYPGQGDSGTVDTTGQRFLRGTQVTDVNGKASFDTIYPGWYHGRTTHIHFKVHLSATREVTSQMYFPEDVTAAVYATGPYAPRGQKDTSNASDHTAHQGGASLPPLLAITGNAASGYTATLTITVAG